MFIVRFIRDDLGRAPQTFDSEDAAMRAIARVFFCDEGDLVRWNENESDDTLVCPTEDSGEGLVCELVEVDDA